MFSTCHTPTVFTCRLVRCWQTMTTPGKTHLNTFSFGFKPLAPHWNRKIWPHGFSWFLICNIFVFRLVILFHLDCSFVCVCVAFILPFVSSPSQKASSRLPLSDPHQPLPGAAVFEPGVSGQLLAVVLGSLWSLRGCSVHPALLPLGVIHLDGTGGR